LKSSETTVPRAIARYWYVYRVRCKGKKTSPLLYTTNRN
jgi:hypothetical protein